MRKIVFSLLIVFVFGSQAFSAELISTEKALKKMFRRADSFAARRISLSGEQIRVLEQEADVTINGTHAPGVLMYTVKEGGTIVGYAFDDTVFGKWGPIRYLAGITPEGSIQSVIVLDYQEIRGKPIAKGRFLRQYKGKDLGDPVRLRRDINGVTGATISSRSITDGVRKLLYIYQLVQPHLE